MPRRYARYLPEYESLNQISTAGSMLLGVGMVLCAAVLIHALLRGKKAPRNPWGAATLEWACSSPPISHNFHTTPTAGDPYDYDDFDFDRESGGYARRPAAAKQPELESVAT